MGLCLLLNELDMKRRRQWNQSYSNKEVALESERYGYVFIHCKEECSDCSAGKAPWAEGADKILRKGFAEKGISRYPRK